MTRRETQYEYEVRFRVGMMGLGGFLDMLRYDGGVVQSWDKVDNDTYVVRLRGPRLTIDRWTSMGIGVSDLNR